MKKYFVSLLSLFAVQAFADDIHLGVPAYNGSGCPMGSVAVSLSPDYKALSMLFGSYQAQAGRSLGKTSDYQNCNIAIPVHVPQGFSVSLISVDYRGFNSIPAGAVSTLRSSYFFAGSTGPSYAKSFVGPVNNDYLVTNNLIAMANVWSACGVDVILRANTSLFAKSNSRMEDIISTVDSVDIKSGILYRLAWRTCR